MILNFLNSNILYIAIIFIALGFYIFLKLRKNRKSFVIYVIAAFVFILFMSPTSEEMVCSINASCTITRNYFGFIQTQKDIPTPDNIDAVIYTSPRTQNRYIIGIDYSSYIILKDKNRKDYSPFINSFITRYKKGECIEDIKSENLKFQDYKNGKSQRYSLHSDASPFMLYSIIAVAFIIFLTSRFKILNKKIHF